MSQRIYLDNNGSTVIDPRVSEVLIQSLNSLYGNPSSSHSPGQKVRSVITRSRDAIASYLGVKSSEIIFTSGGTEGANMILRGFMGTKPKGHLITSTLEHACVYLTAKELEKEGVSVSFISPEDPVKAFGAIDPQAIMSAIRPDTRLIAIMAVNNETGVKTDIQAISKIAAEYNIPLFIDAVCLMGKESFIIPKGVAAMSFSGPKFHAPTGIGFTYVRSGLKLNPLLIGGEQEFGRRAGTPNIPGIIGLAKAIELLSTELPQATERMRYLRDKFEKTLLQNLTGVFVNGEGPRTVNTSNLAFTDVDGESLLIALDAAGISASHGSACASGSSEPSRVLLEMGIPLALAISSIRFSLSRFTTEEEIDRAITIITSIITRMRP